MTSGALPTTPTTPTTDARARAADGSAAVRSDADARDAAISELARSRRRARLRRALTRVGPPSPRHLALVVILLAGLWLVLVVAGAVSDAAVARSGAEELRARIAGLERRVQAARRELEVVRSVPFVQLGARGYGLGGPRERAFALEPGAPTPPPIPLLGAEQERAAARARSPMDEWLDLLFGP